VSSTDYIRYLLCDENIDLINMIQSNVVNITKEQISNIEAKTAADKVVAELKAKQEVEAKAAAELKTKQEAEAKAAADLKAKQEAEAKGAASKKTTITCVKGKLTKKVTAIKPKCPAGYKKKK
jgi:membrane protein involved in colicin uptake